MPKRKGWSKVVEAHGVRVRLYQGAKGHIYRSVVVGRTTSANGKERPVEDRRSLKHSDRSRAEDQARALCRALAEQRLTGVADGKATFGQLRRLYVQHRGPLLSAKRKQFMETALDLLGRFLEPGGAPFQVDDFGQHHADGYVAARRSGKLQPDDRRARENPRAGTIRNELQALSVVCNWGISFKVDGKRLIGHNPVRGVRIPQEKNPRRPVASAARYKKLIEVSGRVDARGQFRLMLTLAWHTGRRVNAICHLRRSDVLLTPDAVREALAAVGLDENLAEVWPKAIRWRAENDKSDFETISPVGPTVVRELESYLRQNPRLGEAWMFTMATDADRPPNKLLAGYQLSRAEKLAGLTKMERGGWHAFRRAWATARKALPVQDVMMAGGWRDVKALQAAYQAADPATVRKVVELGDTG